MDENRVEQVISEALKIDRHLVTDDLSYGDVPEWDSLNHVDLMLRLEQHFGVEIGEDEMLELTSVRAIRAFVEGRRS
jgi:citrate synthase